MVIVTMPVGGSASEAVHDGHAEPGVAQHLGGPLGRTVAGEHHRDPPAVAAPALQVVDDPAGLAVVQRHRLGAERQRDACRRRRSSGSRSSSGSRQGSSSSRRRTVSTRPNGLTDHHGWPQPVGVRAHVGRGS